MYGDIRRVYSGIVCDSVERRSISVFGAVTRALDWGLEEIIHSGNYRKFILYI